MVNRSARTLAELDQAVSLLRTRDQAHTRELRAIRAELAEIERVLTAYPPVSPATNSNPRPPDVGTTAGAAPHHTGNWARDFFRRLFR